MTEQVLARRNAVRDLDIPSTVVGNQLVNGPLASCLVETLLSDLEPLKASDAEAGGIIDLGTVQTVREYFGNATLAVYLQIGHDRALVRVIDDVTIEEGVLPASSDGRAGRNVNDGLGYGLSVRVDSTVANDII